MSISKQPAILSFSFALRDYDIKVMLSAAVLSRVFLVAIYLAAGGPGLSAADLANTIALP